MQDEVFLANFEPLEKHKQSIIELFEPHDWLVEYIRLYRILDDVEPNVSPEIKAVADLMRQVLEEHDIDPYLNNREE